MSEHDSVDMWDQPNGSEGTVSNAVRRYTAQWGLPPIPRKSAFCVRPAKLRAGMKLHDLERIAYGGEEIGDHEFRDGKCVHCSQSE